MSLADRFRASAKQALDKKLASPELHARAARYARGRAQVISGGKPIYKMFVNGAEVTTISGPGFEAVSAAEEGVSFRGGSIVYQFSLLPGAARFMLAMAKEISPVLTGAFAEAWFLVVDGQPWTAPINDIPATATVTLTNFAPYARRLEVGTEIRIRTTSKTGVTRLLRTRRSQGNFRSAKKRYQLTEQIRRAVAAKFPKLDVSRLFISIGSAGGQARGWQVPYVRKHGRGAGAAITYPAVSIKAIG